MGHQRIAEGTPNDARPGESLFGEGIRGTDVRLGVEADAEELQESPDGAYQRGIEVLLAHPAIAGETLHALLLVHRRAIQHRVYVNRSHRADRNAIAAGDTLVVINLHEPLRLIEPPHWTRLEWMRWTWEACASEAWAVGM